jgi:hypothetical protein
MTDKHPELRGDKQVLRISPSTTLRRREPTNEHTANKVPNFVWDHSQQQQLVPDTDPRVSVEATQKTDGAPYRTMNRSGRPFALGVEVGGSPDDRGTQTRRGPRARILKG